MEPEAAVTLPPAAYATALRLRRAGADHAAIAARLGVAPEAVPTLLRIADAKLAQLLDDDPDDGGQTP